ncbi:hypothetical protein N431DRAFT_494089 [Stipitochalara longipes BDJ]|nr:hypothetical protein N431DRAFT_494089 [Stipitochalara longipes BDJ]
MNYCRLSTGTIHPRPVHLSTNWLDGTVHLHGLLLSAHSAENLSETLRVFVSRRGTHLSSVQSIGIESYKDERKNGHFGTIGPPEDKGKFQRFYEYFNDIFFCGCLEGLCAINFTDQPFEEDAENIEHYSLALVYTPCTGPKHRIKILDGYAALIKMRDRSGEWPLLDEEKRLKGWQFAALAVEEATLALLGERLDLSRKISFEHDPSYIVDANTCA